MFRYLVFLGLLAYFLPFVASQNCVIISGSTRGPKANGTSFAVGTVGWADKRFKGVDLDGPTICGGNGIAFVKESKKGGRRRAISGKVNLSPDFKDGNLFYSAAASCLGDDPEDNPDLLIEIIKLNAKNSVSSGWNKVAKLKAKDFVDWTTKSQKLEDDGIYKVRVSQKAKKGQAKPIPERQHTWAFDIQFCPKGSEPTASPSIFTITSAPVTSAASSAASSSAPPPPASGTATAAPPASATATPAAPTPSPSSS